MNTDVYGCIGCFYDSKPGLTDFKWEGGEYQEERAELL